MPARIGASLAIVALLAGPVHSGGEVSKDWIRIESGHFVGVGNADERDLRGTIAQLETFRSAIGRLFPALADTPGRPLTVILLKSPAAFTEFAPRDAKNKPQQGVAGYFMRTSHGDQFVMGSRSDESLLSMAYHEYVHALVHRRLTDVPGWVDEGVADFYSTFAADARKGTVTIGIVPPSRAASLRMENWIPLKDVVALDAATRVWTRQPEKVSMWYAESWAFVHFLAFSSNGARASQLSAYLSGVRAGKSGDAAFTDAFGAPISQVEAELRAYLRTPLPATRVALDSPVTAGGAGLTVRRLSVAEAQGVQGCLLADNGALEAAEKHLSAALADNPRHVEAQACLGQVRVEQRRAAEALAILEPLVASAPDSADLHYRLGRALMEGARMDDAIAAFSRATTLKLDFVDAWFGLSLATLAQHRDAQANAAFRQVLNLDADVEWMRRRSSQALALDRADVAAADARAYIARHGLADDSGVYVAFVGAIAYRRIGKAEEASALLDEAVPSVDPKGWTARVLAFMRGKMDAKAFLDAAGSNGERTEVHAYLGFADLQAGRQEEGRAHLEWVRERGSRNYTEYDLALGELARLERAKR